MGFFDKVQNSSKGCVGILSALLNGYQEPEPEPAPELGSEPAPELGSAPEPAPQLGSAPEPAPEPALELGSEPAPEPCSNVYVDYRIPGNDIQYPGEKTIYRSIEKTGHVLVLDM